MPGRDRLSRQLLQLSEVLDVFTGEVGAILRGGAVTWHDHDRIGLRVHELLHVYHGLLRPGHVAVQKPRHRRAISDDRVAAEEGLAPLVPHELVAGGLRVPEVLCDHFVASEHE